MSSTQKKRIRIGFIGVGNMGQAAHLRNYASLTDDCEIVALAELRPELAAKVAARYGIPRVYRNYEELLAKERLDAIVASQPFERHGILIPELARAGVPIFCEKPIAGSIPVGERIVKALEANDTWLMVGYHKRSDPATVYAKNEIDRAKRTGELGRLRYVRITIPPGDWIAGGFNEIVTTQEATPDLGQDPPPEDMDEKTAARYISFVNYYIHQVNLLRYLLGEDYRVTHADPSGVVLVARSESGVPGVIEMSPYSTGTGWEESALVAFEKGYVKFDLPAPLVCNQAGRVVIFRELGNGVPPLSSVPELPPVHAMRNQALNFIKAVRGEAPPPCLAPEALQDLCVARDYLRALDSGVESRKET